MKLKSLFIVKWLMTLQKAFEEIQGGIIFKLEPKHSHYRQESHANFEHNWNIFEHWVLIGTLVIETQVAIWHECTFLVFAFFIFFILVLFTSYAFLSIFILLYYLHFIYLYTNKCLSHFELVLNANSRTYFLFRDFYHFFFITCFPNICKPRSNPRRCIQGQEDVMGLFEDLLRRLSTS